MGPLLLVTRSPPHWLHRERFNVLRCFACLTVLTHTVVIMLTSLSQPFCQELCLFLGKVALMLALFFFEVLQVFFGTYRVVGLDVGL